MDVQDWSPRDEFLALIRKWQLAAVIFILGTAAGWLTGYIWPARFEARAALKVHFNSDAIYLTPDDYKNWQVEELEDLALSEPVLEETLRRLQTAGGDWQDWSAEDLRAVGAPRWRNAGAWYLAAALPKADQAAELVDTWRSVLYETAIDALDHAAAFNTLDRRLDELMRQIGQADADIAQLKVYRTEIEAWLALPVSDDRKTSRAAVIAERLSRSIDLGIILVIDFPDSTGTPAARTTWAQAARTAVEEALTVRQATRTSLLETYTAISQEWLQEKTASRGLSAYLSITFPDPATVQIERQYRRGLLAVTGGLVAVLLWVSAGLAFSRRRAVEEYAG